MLKSRKIKTSKARAVRSSRILVELDGRSEDAIDLQIIGLGKKVELDEEAGVMKNISIITKGPAMGHGFEVDDIMLEQVSKKINVQRNGVKVRFTHPGWMDDLESRIGRCKDCRVEGGQVRGDIHIANYASKSPKGDIKSFLFGLAAEEPDSIGLSISFVPAEFKERKKGGLTMPPLGRVKKVLGVDFVGEPAANPGGLLSSKQDNNGGTTMLELSKKLRKFLTSRGLAVDSQSDEEICNELGITEENLSNWESKAENVDLGDGGEPEPEPEPEPEDLGVGDDDPDPEDLARQIVRDERKRCNAIRNLSKKHNLGEAWADKMVNSDASVATANNSALEMLAARYTPPKGLNCKVGDDLNLSTMKTAMVHAICLRAGTVIAEPHERAAEFRYRTLVDMGRFFLSQAGVQNADSMPRNQVAHYLLNQQKLVNDFPTINLQGTGSFVGILSDSVNKTVEVGFNEYPQQWRTFCKAATNPDFKTIERARLAESPSLKEIRESRSIDYIKLSDKKETYVLKRFAEGVIFSIEALTNDDTGALGSAPLKLTQAAARIEDELAFMVLILNAAMADGTALCHTDRGNIATSGGAISIATLTAAAVAMGMQRGLGGAIEYIKPSVLACPLTASYTAQQVVASKSDPAASHAEVINPHYNKYQMVTHPILDAYSTTAWWTLADPIIKAAIELCHLEGAETPQVSQTIDFDTSALKIKVEHVAAAKAMEAGGVYKNAGA